MVDLTEKDLADFKKLFEKEGITYDTEAEYREAAYNIVNLCDLALQVAMEEKARDKRLKNEPKGFSFKGEGRMCSLCKHGVADDMWYDKWGMKCLDCQDAFNKKIVPGYVFKDRDNEKSVTDSTLAYKTGINVRTIRKLVRRGDIKVRILPKGPMVILRKENPNLLAILAKES
jgi:hypothetical protein